MNSKIVIITGQTATGKTDLAYEYAEKLGGELINADSRQAYKYLDIISGKDFTPRYKTHLYDVVDPKEYYSSFEWTKQVLQTLKRLELQKKTPIVVGGSYLYIKHWLYGIETEGIGPDWKMRKDLDKKTLDELQQTLNSLNPSILQQMNSSDRNNPRRLMRKIEIVQSKRSSLSFPRRLESRKTGSPIRSGMTTNLQFIGLRFKTREKLVSAIKKRVENRIQIGAFEEVEKLLEMKYTESDPGLKTIGYQQLIKYFQKKLAKQEAIDEWITKEIQYAKRQYTFMKKDKNITWKFI